VVAERVNLGPGGNGGGKTQKVAVGEESSEEVPF
jgi:hypothetical protein